MTKSNHVVADRTRQRIKLPGARDLHPAWLAFIQHCGEMGFGEISQLKIQDGLPVMAEETKKKVKFI